MGKMTVRDAIAAPAPQQLRLRDALIFEAETYLTDFCASH
jgi:hypothetical protein